MSDVINEKIADKLRKLLSHARGTDNEAEAASYMAKAQELMADYNVTMVEIEATGRKAEGGKREKTKTVGRALYQYQRQLMTAIASANYCICYLTDMYEQQGSREVKRKGYILVGREANVVTTQIMFDYLNVTMERLVPITSNSERLSKFAISWKEGCADRLRGRIIDQKYAMERESKARANEQKALAKHPSAAMTGALVVLGELTETEYELNLDIMYGLKPGTTMQRRLAREAEARKTALVAKTEPFAPAVPLTKAEREKMERDNKKWEEKWNREQRAFWARKDMTAYNAGSKAGDKISLSQQVTGEELKKIG